MPAGVAVEEINQDLSPFETDWEARAPEPKRCMHSIWNVRAVAFVAKPQKAAALAECFEGPILRLLHQVPGFAGAMILNCHKEWRRILVLTFWESEAQAAKCRWEDYTSVRRLTDSLVDLCAKVETFEAVLPAALSPDQQKAMPTFS